ncbi:MAG TPA: FtsX-like permease family protein, partial [Defluviitaleaceae bacterium]|nr:FtsX-like permease family protein [Defluviitaleaceae bacterium]
MLISLVAILAVNLLGSIDTLMTQGKAPHFLQMHSGEIDINRLENFAKKNDKVEEFQILEFLNMDGEKIKFGDITLRDSVQDNGFSIQSEKFDYLIDLDGNVIHPSRGELYIPISYMKENITKVGDTAKICGKEFVVSGFLRDTQMNSSLCLSKRFLINEADYEEIKKYGKVEYLIEFRLKDLSGLNEFENEYIAAGLESNGPVITYPIFKMINGISDGIMIVVILLVSILVTLIALMCIRFTLLTKIEEDYREIGVMKAIGLYLSDIKKFFLAKYMLIAGIGSLIGFLISFLFRGPLLYNIRLYMGESQNSHWSIYFALIGVTLVFYVIVAYIKGVLNRFKKISPSEAIRFGISNDKVRYVSYFLLSKYKLPNTNLFLGINDVLSKKKLYSTMFIVFVISVFIIIVPQNLYNTISSKNFIKHMGIGACDIRIDIQQVDNIAEKTMEIANEMEKDEDIKKYAVLTTKAYRLINSEGLEEILKVELGDHSIFPIEYAKGRAPIKENEIALSQIKAEELNKNLGDTITLIIDTKEKNLEVCGIYSDVTNGGKTAKANFIDDSADIMWSIINGEIADKFLIAKKVSEYAQEFPFAKVSGIDEYIEQTFGQIINSVKVASKVSIAVASLISILITLLFMKMLITKERNSIALMKSFGFTNSDVKTQYFFSSVFVLLVSIIIGTVLTNTLGELIA